MRCMAATDDREDKPAEQMPQSRVGQIAAGSVYIPLPVPNRWPEAEHKGLPSCPMVAPTYFVHPRGAAGCLKNLVSF